MPITAEQANQLLLQHPEEYSSPSALRNLISQISTDAPGKITVTYSGAVGNGVWSSDIVNWLRDNSPDAG